MREERFRILAEAQVPAVASYLRRRMYPLPTSDLDDLIEEVLVVIWRRLDELPPDNELAWMLGVARNTLRNAKRAQRRRMGLAASLPQPTAQASAEAWMFAASDVREALQTLRSSERDILLLHVWDGLDTRQIATALSISERAVEARLARARKKVGLKLQTPRIARSGVVPPISLQEE